MFRLHLNVNLLLPCWVFYNQASQLSLKSQISAKNEIEFLFKIFLELVNLKVAPKKHWKFTENYDQNVKLHAKVHNFKPSIQKTTTNLFKSLIHPPRFSRIFEFSHCEPCTTHTHTHTHTQHMHAHTHTHTHTHTQIDTYTHTHTHNISGENLTHFTCTKAIYSDKKKVSIYARPFCC